MSNLPVPTAQPQPPAHPGLLGRLRAAVARRMEGRLSRPVDGLDKLLDRTDAKIQGRFRVVEAAPDAPPRHRFTAQEVPMREAHYSQINFARFRRLLPVMPPLMFRILRSGRFFRERLPTGRTASSPALLEEVEALARSLGAFDVAYLNEVAPSEVFAGLAVPAPGVIVYAVEMAPEPIANAPSFETFHEVAQGYGRLARIGDAIAEFLQARGHAAFPGTALGGQSDYVALAARAGMGGIGYHGMLLTPQAGARVRISTVYTSLAGMPERGQSEHEWVRSFCDRCRNCVRTCPPQAIHPTPRAREDGAGTACIDHVLCRDYFARQFGCALCITVCPFTTAGYARIKEGLVDPPERSASLDPRPFKVAVVGAGAAGFYTAMGLLERTSAARIDLIERLPMPHGLVRYGVAPDHPEVRSKGEAFDRALEDPRVRLLGNVRFGVDVQHEELRAHYDAVVYATGASRSRSLGVPGEGLPGVVPSWSFVGWINGHPDHAGPGAAQPVLGSAVTASPRSGPTARENVDAVEPSEPARVPLARCAVIVGGGNVALDVARMLLSPIERLEPTDIGPEALAALRSQPTERVHILVRRGREDAAFTPRELADLQALAGDRLTLHFHTEVARFEGTERVERVITKAGETLEAGLVVTAIGFASDALPGVPHDPERNVVRTEEGRVVDATGAVCPGVYASGWVRRGPRGIIGRNKEDAEQVVALLLADLPDAPRCPAGDLKALLEARGVRVVDEADYDRLRREERLAGSRENRWAVRRTDTVALLASLDEGARLGGAP